MHTIGVFLQTVIVLTESYKEYNCWRCYRKDDAFVRHTCSHHQVPHKQLYENSTTESPRHSGIRCILCVDYSCYMERPGETIYERCGNKGNYNRVYMYVCMYVVYMCTSMIAKHTYVLFLL